MIRLNPEINIFLLGILIIFTVYIFMHYKKKKIFLIPFIFEVFSAFLILLLLLRPELILSFELKKGKNLIVLLDKSESMKIKNETGKTRFERVKEILYKNDFFRKQNPSFFVFDRNVKKIKKQDIENIIPDGKKTCIGKIIPEILKNYKDQATGILILTDGQNNCKSQNLPDVKIPFYCIGIGGEKIKDVRVDNVLTNSPVYTGDIAKIDVYISQQGLDGEKCSVVLKEGKKEIERKYIYLKGKKTKTTFEKKFSKSGLYLYYIEIEKEDMEKQNNIFPFLIRVIYPGIKVVYVDGYLRWEYKYLTRFLSGYSKVIPVFFVKIGKTLYQQEGWEKIKIENGLFTNYQTLNNFHIIIIGDISFSSFSEKEITNIKKFVENGGGIILLGGKNFLKGVEKTSLKEIIPVRSRDENLKYGKFPLTLSPVGKNIPVFNIKELPSVSSINITELNEGSFSIINSSKYPFLACKIYGEGKVLCLNTDNLWKWYISGNKTIYEKLLSRIIYYLAPPANYLKEGTKIPLIKISERKYFSGEKIKGIIETTQSEKKDIYLYLKNIQKGTRTGLNINKSGEFEFIPEQEGNYVIELVSGKMKTYKLITVYSNPEFLKIERNENYLKSIVSSLKGDYIPEEELKGKINLKLKRKIIYKKIGIYRKEEIFIIFLIFTLLNVSWWMKRKYGNI